MLINHFTNVCKMLVHALRLTRMHPVLPMTHLSLLLPSHLPLPRSPKITARAVCNLHSPISDSGLDLPQPGSCSPTPGMLHSQGHLSNPPKASSWLRLWPPHSHPHLPAHVCLCSVLFSIIYWLLWPLFRLLIPLSVEAPQWPLHTLPFSDLLPLPLL